MKKEINRLSIGFISEETRRQIHDLKSKLFLLEEQLGLLWKQTPKQHWHREGDRNTQFFHNHASKRRDINHISALRDSNGTLCHDPKDIEPIILSYFASLFSSTPCNPIDVETTLSRIPRKVDGNSRGLLEQDFTDVEVRKALKDMHPFKSPGPDGMMPVFFFQKN